MHSAFKPILRAALFYLLSVLAIAAVLVAGKFVVDAVRGALSARDRLALVLDVQTRIANDRQVAAADLTGRMRAARQLPLARVDERIRAVHAQLAQLAHAADSPAARPDSLPVLLKGGPAAYAGELARGYRGRLERELLAQELGYLQGLRAYLFALESRAAATAELRRLLEQHRAIYARLQQKQREVARLGWFDSQRMERPWARSPAQQALAADIGALTTQNNRAAAAYRAQALALRRMESVSALRDFAVDGERLDASVAALQAQVDDARAALSRNLAARVAEALRQALPAALGILLLCIAGKAAIRAMFYFVLAPLATRGAALRLDPAQASAAPVELVSASAVSQTIALAPQQELLVLPDYLQSAPVGAARGTRWLIKGRVWASLTSGTVLLTCVRTGGPEQQLVLSASDDGLSEIALVRIPPGQALALQPRALVGLIADAGAPLDIRWHWRLASLHAWLTLQLRFFVIRGPVTLALQGKRGVRVQGARDSHAVRQTATLGFSTDSAYATVRSEPFLPYLRGRAPLLHDRFGGGIYIYDETPEAGRKAGRAGRGLEGLTDALLKLVGY